MSTHLLTAWNARAQALHTAADDLESFLWVLIWSLNNIFKMFATITSKNSKVLQLEAILSSHTFFEILHRDLYIKTFWYDKVFKALINDWQKIAQKSQDIVLELQQRLFTSIGHRDAKGILDELDKHCEEVYENYIQEGYEHFQHLQNPKR
jgi:hypothetical protein